MNSNYHKTALFKITFCIILSRFDSLSGIAAKFSDKIISLYSLYLFFISWCNQSSYGNYLSPHISNYFNTKMNLSMIRFYIKLARSNPALGSNSCLNLDYSQTVNILASFLKFEAQFESKLSKFPSQTCGSSGGLIVYVLLFFALFESWISDFLGSYDSWKKSSSQLDELSPFFLLLQRLQATLSEYFRALFVFAALSDIIFLQVYSLKGKIKVSSIVAQLFSPQKRTLQLVPLGSAEMIFPGQQGQLWHLAKTISERRQWPIISDQKHKQ